MDINQLIQEAERAKKKRMHPIPNSPWVRHY